MIEDPSTAPARRAGRCLLLGDTTTTVPAPDGWLAVVVAPAHPAASVVPAILAACEPSPDGILLLGADSALAADLAGAAGLPVVAADGPVLAAPGGSLFAESGWSRHTPDGRRVADGTRWPAPAWQPLVPDTTPWPVPARPVPAGWLLGEDTGSGAVALAVAVDPDRPRLLFAAGVTGAVLAAAIRALPAAVRPAVDLVPVGPGQGAGRAAAADAARALGEPVRLCNGVPLHAAPSGDVVVHALDADGRPVWAEPAWLLRVRPDGAERVVASSPPQASLRAVDAATYAMDAGWLVRLSGGGIHAGPAAQEPANGDGYRVEVGAPGLDINDLLWPPLSALFTALLTDLPAPIEIVVSGDATDWGVAAARELTERHQGGTRGGAAEKPVRWAEALPLAGSVPEAPAAEAGRGRRRRLVLAAAAGLAALLAAGGVAAAMSGGGDNASPAAAPEHGIDPNRFPTPAGATAAGGASAHPSRTVPPASRGASPSRGGGAPAASGEPASASPSRPPVNLADGVNLAAGTSTRDSGHADVYGSGNVTDADAMTYWESHSNAFPQWVQVDLGAPADLRRAVLRLPQSALWQPRTQRIQVLGSADDRGFTSLSGPATYTFDNASGQRVTVALPGGQWRYVRVVFTANSVQNAGQLSSLELYRS